MAAFKILVTSQKGGVGKSTVSANLAAYLRRQNESVTLVDFDTHGSSSTWLTRAPNIGIAVQHHVLPLDQGGNRPLLDARLHLRRAATSSDVVICDLTWSDSIAGELMFEYDLVVVPTSVSEIELATTAGFLSKHRWVFDSASRTPPTLLLCPTRVHAEQLDSEVFSRQRFPVSFMLAPPVLEGQSARDLFERGYLIDLTDDCGRSFVEFGKAVCAAREMHRHNAQRQQQNAQRLGSAFRPAQSIQTIASHAAKAERLNVLGSSTALAGHQSLLGRHRLQKTRVEEHDMPALVPTRIPMGLGSMSNIGIPQFLKRMSRSN